MWDGHAFARRLRFAKDPWDVIGEIALHWHGTTIPSARVEGGSFSDRFQKWLTLTSACPFLATAKSDRIVKWRDDDSGEFQIFLIENKDLWTIGVRALELYLPDPPVYIRGKGDEWRELNARFSQFTLQWAVYGSRFQGKLFASGRAEGTNWEELGKRCAWLPFPTWQAMRIEHLFFAGPDLLVQLDREDDGWDSVWVTARTKTALESAMASVTCDWDSFS